LERRISKGYVRTSVQTATGRKRAQFLPVAAGGGVGGGAALTEMPLPDEEERP
jgi:hypothetical protein